LDASGSSGHACDEPGFFQRQHHLVDGRSGNLEMATHVGFGRGAFEDPAIGVDEGQVLALVPVISLFFPGIAVIVISR